MSASPVILRPTSTREERRAKRDARRAKQRGENAGRAARMHVDRLTWERDAHLAEFPSVGPALPRINVGCSGWFYWHWRGGFYAADLPTAKWFTHYADYFKTVELNAPFYSWPTIATVRGWTRQLGRRRFVYTVKASELITHVKRFTGTRTLIRDFGHIADLLGPRMAASSFSYRPAFTTRALAWIESSHSWTRPGATSWNFDIVAGGTSGSLQPFVQAAPSSAPAAVRGCRMNW